MMRGRYHPYFVNIMINPSEYHGNFAADHADHYDSMIGSMNYSAAADDVHVSAVSTATLGGSDDVMKNVAADYVHVSTVTKATLGGSDDGNKQEYVGYPMTRTDSCVSIDIDVGEINDIDIGEFNWSFDNDVLTTNMAVTTRKRKGSPKNGESGDATLDSPSVSNTRSAKKCGVNNDQEKGGDKMEEGCHGDVVPGAAAAACPSADDENFLDDDGAGTATRGTSLVVTDNVEGDPDDNGVEATTVTLPLMMADSTFEGVLDDDGAGGAAALVGLSGGNNQVPPFAGPLKCDNLGIVASSSRVTRRTRRARGTRNEDLVHEGKANERTVLFLMPDLGEVESLLKFKLPHNKWLKYYECLLTDVDGEVVRQENGDTLLLGDEMFLVAIEVARAQLSVGEKGQSFDLNDCNSGNYKSYVDSMNAIFRKFAFMNTR